MQVDSLEVKMPLPASVSSEPRKERRPYGPFEFAVLALILLIFLMLLIPRLHDGLCSNSPSSLKHENTAFLIEFGKISERTDRIQRTLEAGNKSEKQSLPHALLSFDERLKKLEGLIEKKLPSEKNPPTDTPSDANSLNKRVSEAEAALAVLTNQVGNLMKLREQSELSGIITDIKFLREKVEDLSRAKETNELKSKIKAVNDSLAVLTIKVDNIKIPKPLPVTTYGLILKTQQK